MLKDGIKSQLVLDQTLQKFVVIITITDYKPLRIVVEVAPFMKVKELRSTA